VKGLLGCGYFVRKAYVSLWPKNVLVVTSGQGRIITQLRDSPECRFCQKRIHFGIAFIPVVEGFGAFSTIAAKGFSL